MSKEQKFLKAINDAFGAYNTYGARSNKKLIPVHKWFANIIEHDYRLNEKIDRIKCHQPIETRIFSH